MGPGRIACLCQTCHFEWERFEESSRAYREFIKVKTRLEAFLNCLANHCRPEGLSSFYGELDRHCDAVHDAELALANQVDAWLEKDDLFSPPIDDDYDED